MAKLLVFISFVFILMTLTLFYVIKGIIDTIKEKSKLYFAVKMQEYDEEKKKNKQESSSNNYVKKDHDIDKSMDINESFIYVENSNDYEVENLFLLTKMVDNYFTLNPEDLIVNFICEKTTYMNSNLYENLLSLRKKIDEYGVYYLITDLSKREELINILKTNYKKIYDEYFISNKEFDINTFVSYVDSLISENNPSIYVYVGKEDENYDRIDSRIKTVYDDSIYKGFKIVYKNKLYDYSLS